VSVTGNYDPFSANGITNANVNVNFTRFVNSGGGKTQSIDFYFTQPTGSPAFQITYAGDPVLYTRPATHALSYTSPPSGTVFYSFGGVAQPDNVTLPFQITIPPGLDVGPGYSIAFDVDYVCKGTGGIADVDSPATLHDVIRLNINVLSALQASYVGPALDFGEIGGVTTAQAPTHVVSGAIRVASSGPYTVALSSGAANPYRMTYPGGSTATAGQYVPYKVKFLGKTKDNASPNFTTQGCIRAGLGGQNLPITATLEDGGQGKTPAAVYSDTLTVTVTPIVGAGFQLDCPTL
jgi:spore coat protein U-like protein